MLKGRTYISLSFKVLRKNIEPLDAEIDSVCSIKIVSNLSIQHD